MDYDITTRDWDAREMHLYHGAINTIQVMWETKPHCNVVGDSSDKRPVSTARDSDGFRAQSWASQHGIMSLPHKAPAVRVLSSFRPHCSTAGPSLPRGGAVTLVRGNVTPRWCCWDSGWDMREFLGGTGVGGTSFAANANLHIRLCGPTQKPSILCS